MTRQQEVFSPHEIRTVLMAAADHGLEARGQAFYSSVVNSGPASFAQESLVVEAARMADLLEHLHGIIQGKGVINLMHLRHMNPHDDTQVTMTVDGVLAERRQLQLAFERLCKTLEVSAVVSTAKGDTGDDLAAGRAARIAAATGT